MKLHHSEPPTRRHASPMAPRAARQPFRLLKRLIDIAVVLLTLPVMLPLMGLIAIAIRVDTPGPILFRQQRTGQHGRRFGMWKFRTMVANAEELKAQLAHLNILPSPDFKVINDPRVTRVGRFLRRTSLDELPQLFNVLNGEMTLVGPRPTSFAANTYDLWHTKRLEVVPGITGLWQISGRHEMTFDERLRLDIAYIDRQSLSLDLKIIALTFASVFRRSGA